METKRLIIAIALSIAVIAIYQMFFVPKSQPVPQKQIVQAETQEVSKEEGQDNVLGKSSMDAADILFGRQEVVKDTHETPVPVNEDLKGNQVRDITVESDLFTAVFTTKGAGLKSFILKKYKDDSKQPLDLISSKVNDFGIYPFYISTEADLRFKDVNDGIFTYDGEPIVNVGDTGRQEIVFRYSDVAKNISVTKTFAFVNNSYIVDVDCDIVKDGKAFPAPIVFGPDLENNILKERMGTKLRIGAFNGDSIKEVKSKTK